MEEVAEIVAPVVAEAVGYRVHEKQVRASGGRALWVDNCLRRRILAVEGFVP